MLANPQPVHASQMTEPPSRRRQTGGAAALPANLEAAVSALSGVSLHDVAVHYDSPEPGGIGANALARGGSEIHLGPGQDRHLPHEAWHVAQQRRGAVAPTLVLHGRPINAHASLEAEAERMGTQAAQRAATVRAGLGGVRDSGRTAGMASAAAGSAGVIQAQGLLSSLTRMLPAVPERVKEWIDPRRWRVNPFWQYHYQGFGVNPEAEVPYEAAHSVPWAPGPPQGFMYHSRERHGAEHTLENIHARTQAPVGPPNPGPGNPSAMENVVQPGVNIPRTPAVAPSSRFATPAWHSYARNVAMQHALQNLQPGTSFQPGLPTAAAQLPANSQRFHVNFEDSPVGFGVDAAGQATPSHWVEVNVSRDPHTGHAWVTKFHPIADTAVPAQPIGPLPQYRIPRHRVDYHEIPWFSTQA